MPGLTREEAVVVDLLVSRRLHDVWGFVERTLLALLARERTVLAFLPLLGLLEYLLVSARAEGIYEEGEGEGASVLEVVQDMRELLGVLLEELTRFNALIEWARVEAEVGCAEVM